MNKNKLQWCCRQKDGIHVIELKPHLSIAYFNEADETLKNMILITGKWKVITAYYACYHALYALLMKCGIKCEIHDCTIELMPLFGFNEQDHKSMQALKEDRIQAQYYLKNIELKDEQQIKRFIHACKLISDNLTSQMIEQIRTTLGKDLEPRGTTQ